MDFHGFLIRCWDFAPVCHARIKPSAGRLNGLLIMLLIMQYHLSATNIFPVLSPVLDMKNVAPAGKNEATRLNNGKSGLFKQIA